MRSFPLTSCTFLAVVVATNALQSNKDIASNQWNPFDLFRTPETNVNASAEATAPVEAALDDLNLTLKNIVHEDENTDDTNSSGDASNSAQDVDKVTMDGLKLSTNSTSAHKDAYDISHTGNASNHSSENETLGHSMATNSAENFGEVTMDGLNLTRNSTSAQGDVDDIINAGNAPNPSGENETRGDSTATNFSQSVGEVTIDGLNVTVQSATDDISYTENASNHWGENGTQGQSTASNSSQNIDESCEQFCTDNAFAAAQESWEEKCGWDTCKGCDVCKRSAAATSSQNVVETCEQFCTDSAFAASQESWEEKCSWHTCKGCDVCQKNKYVDASTIEPVWFAKGDTSKPRMLITQGCDGSSAVLRHAHFLLALHGIQTPVKDSAHVLAKEYSEMAHQRNGVPRAMRQMHMDYQKQNKTSIFKGKIGRDEAQFLSKTLSKLGTLVVTTSRRNTLNQAICMIKDCFASPSMGHPIMGGNKSDLCLKRRKMNTTSYKAFVNTTTLIGNLKHLQEKSQNATDALINEGYKAPHIDTEDLLGFQWSKEAVWTALPAWKRLLLAWDVRPSAGVIEKYLIQSSGTRAPPFQQKDAISNFEAVETELNKHQKFSWMLNA